MTKQYLKTAPLVHVTADFRFSEFAFNDDEINIFHRNLMDINYPELIKNEEKRVEYRDENIASETSIKKSISTSQRFCFLAANKQSIIDLREGRLIFKVTEYDVFDNYLSDFLKVINAFKLSIPIVCKSPMKSIALRYTDFIVPKPDCELKEYISPELLPFPIDIDHQERVGITQSHAKISEKRYLRVTFEEHLFKKGRGIKILPDDLLERDKRLALLIDIDHMTKNLVDGRSYGLLDIEHQHSFDLESVFSSEKLDEQLKDLHHLTDQFFWKNISKKAESDWGMTTYKGGSK